MGLADKLFGYTEPSQVDVERMKASEMEQMAQIAERQRIARERLRRANSDIESDSIASLRKRLSKSEDK